MKMRILKAIILLRQDDGQFASRKLVHSFRIYDVYFSQKKKKVLPSHKLSSLG
jgi:hypothetical protein